MTSFLAGRLRVRFRRIATLEDFVGRLPLHGLWSRPLSTRPPATPPPVSGTGVCSPKDRTAMTRREGERREQVGNALLNQGLRLTSQEWWWWLQYEWLTRHVDWRLLVLDLHSECESGSGRARPARTTSRGGQNAWPLHELLGLHVGDDPPSPDGGPGSSINRSCGVRRFSLAHSRTSSSCVKSITCVDSPSA